jgi:hypothetical protein
LESLDAEAAGKRIPANDAFKHCAASWQREALDRKIAQQTEQSQLSSQGDLP